MHFISQYKGLRKENYILFFGRIVTNLGGMVWPVLTLILNHKMGFSATGVALVMLIFSLIMLPVTMIGGRLADKCNKKYVIIVCDLISVIFYITCAFIDLSYFSLALIMIGAACQNMEYPSYNALIADITPTKDRERAYSMQYLGSQYRTGGISHYSRNPLQPLPVAVISAKRRIYLYVNHPYILQA